MTARQPSGARVDSTMVTEAVVARRCFGANLDAARVAVLLPVWRGYPKLAPHERRAVLAAFPTTGG